MRFGLPVLVLMTFVALFGDSTPKPALPVSGYGCIVQPTDKSLQSFTATVWAEHNGERDWKFQLSRRKKRIDCLKDCDSWMAEMQKAAGKR